MANLLERTLEFLRRRKAAYQMCFRAPGAEAVLKDLARFCRAAQSYAVPGNHDRTYLLAGRNEVWQRIEQHMNFTPQELAAIYRAAALEKETTDD